jgi:hypothetical protein
MRNHDHAHGTAEAGGHSHGVERLYHGHRARDMRAGRLHHGVAMQVPEMAKPMMARLREAFEQPFRGITADGEVRGGLFPLAGTGVSTQPIADAARAYLASLRRVDHRHHAMHPLDGPDRRRWLNAFPDWMPSGLFLADLERDEREAALRVIEATLSARGFADVRKIMRANDAMGAFINHSRDTLNEYGFFFTIFGQPSTTAPWGWRIMGNHLVIHCTVVGDQLCLTPAFYGSEMTEIQEGPHAGQTLFVEEQRLGLELATSLSPAQRTRAVLFPSMRTQDLPPPMRGPDGRHLAGAGQDNRAIAPEGVPANALSAGQRELLLRLADVYVGRMSEPHRSAELGRIRTHLDETRFAWIGDPEKVPFYYRIHGPTILIEFDHHSGVFLDNPDPEPFHVHTIVRTPNGHDYGMDWLREHYARFPHE